MTAAIADFGEILRLCQNRHHRLALSALGDEGQTLTVDELAKTILGHERGPTSTEASEAERSRIRISLHHAIIPALESTGALEYDAERKLVEPAAELDRVLSAMASIDVVDPTLEAHAKR